MKTNHRRNFVDTKRRSYQQLSCKILTSGCFERGKVGFARAKSAIKTATHRLNRRNSVLIINEQYCECDEYA